MFCAIDPSFSYQLQLQPLVLETEEGEGIDPVVGEELELISMQGSAEDGRMNRDRVVVVSVALKK